MILNDVFASEQSADVQFCVVALSHDWSVGIVAMEGVLFA